MRLDQFSKGDRKMDNNKIVIGPTNELCDVIRFWMSYMKSKIYSADKES